MSLTRREVLTLGGATLAAATLAAATLAPRAARAQTPRRGGTLTLRHVADPPTWDPDLTISLQDAHRPHVHAQPASCGTRRVRPWRRERFRSRAISRSRGRNTSETTYVFKLRRGVRWHPRPP